MNLKSHQIIFQIILTITIFSLYVGFALLVINHFFHEDLPGYTIGRLCGWDFSALAVAAVIAWFLIKKWGNIELTQVENQSKLTINPKFGIYFAVYFLIAIIIGIWQFWVFSQQF